MQTKKIRNMRIAAVVILILLVIASALNVFLTKENGLKEYILVLLFVGMGLNIFLLSVTSKKNIQPRNLPKDDLRKYMAEHKE